ncbi:MAG: RdgB/HAM1 family non-canonical purine NTP pyrophosphatase [Bacteroidales bacterium]|nr:RdgB/HAM1 family non-canonical purine NTP pyrophosphatase [Bacteroidales bacterium]
MKILFATNNQHKLKEIRELIGDKIYIESLNDHGIFEEIPETGQTLEQNALQKARYINNKYNIDCFADDTGLEVKALDNRPGVYSARYAGENCTFDDNVNKLLKELGDIKDRRACFRTVIVFIRNNRIHKFEGIIEGIITKQKSGYEGFGYDPVFKPNSSVKTFAEMSRDEKISISHRSIAMNKLVTFLKTIS